MNIPNLIDALKKDECVLVLGPRAIEVNGKNIQDALNEQIRAEIQKKGGSVQQDISKADIVREFLKLFPSSTQALEQLQRLLSAFYETYEFEDIPVFEQIARLPFKYIINTTPDNLLSLTLDRHNKTPVWFDFHFKKSEYNDEMNRKAVHLDTEITEDSPLIYNLLGHYDRPDSLVLTDEDRLRFLETVLQQEKEATLPTNITYPFIRPPLSVMRKTFVFIGFDFNEWHLRMFMHLLRRKHEHLPYSITVQENQRALLPEAQNFFIQNFEMEFTEESPARFLENFYQQLRKPEEKVQASKISIMLISSPEDEDLRDEVETYLAPVKNSGLAEIWHERKIEPGEDIGESIRHHLETAQVIIPLVTADFLASDRLNDYIDIVVNRHYALETKVFPILMKPCAIQDTSLYELNTLFPKPRGKALSQETDRAQTLTTITGELKRMLERMIKKQNA